MVGCSKIMKRVSLLWILTKKNKSLKIYQRLNKRNKYFFDATNKIKQEKDGVLQMKTSKYRIEINQFFLFFSIIFYQFRTMSSLQAYGLQDLKKNNFLKQDYLKQINGRSKPINKSSNITSEPMNFLKGSNLDINLKMIGNNIKADFWATFQPFFTNTEEIGFTLNLKLHIQQKNIFYVQNMDRLNQWKQYFSKICVLKGFYNDYKPLSKIGTGKSASVFLARKRSDGEKVAIKAFSKRQIENDPFFQKALQNQVNTLRSLESPHVIKMKALYETEKSFYLVSQYIEGKTLRNLLQKTQLKYSQSKLILKKLLYGLSYLDIKDIVHRDLKPENIMIESSSGRVVIVDFGLAAICKKKEYLYSCCGTPGFVAPEILNQTYDYISSKADIFSLGIIFHLMLLNKFPYTGNTYEDIVKQNKMAAFQIQGSEYEKVPAQAKYLLNRMLQKDPLQRISANEILQYFQQNKNRNKKCETLSQIKQPKSIIFKCRGSAGSLIEKSNSVENVWRGKVGRVY